MISSLVIGFGLVGRIGDRFRDDQVYSQTLAALDQTVFHTKEDLSAAIASKPDGFEALWSMLDLNKDGQIDQFELAVLEVDGAHMVGFQLDQFEALALAGGAALEDGDLSKLAVDHEHFQSWFVDNVWASYLELGDQDGDGQLDDSEWRLVVEASSRVTEHLHRREADDLPGDAELLEADLHVPGSVAEAFIQAGYVYNQVLAENQCGAEEASDDDRRRLTHIGELPRAMRSFGGFGRSPVRYPRTRTRSARADFCVCAVVVSGTSGLFGGSLWG